MALTLPSWIYFCNFFRILCWQQEGHDTCGYCNLSLTYSNRLHYGWCGGTRCQEIAASWWAASCQTSNSSYKIRFIGVFIQNIFKVENHGDMICRCKSIIFSFKIKISVAKTALFGKQIIIFMFLNIKITSLRRKVTLKSSTYW